MSNANKGARSARNILRLVGLLFLAVGAVFTYLAFDFIDNALPATGTVVSVEMNYGDDSVTYRPTIRFIDFEDRKQSGETFLASSSYDFEVGSKVDILYDTREPTSLIIDTWFSKWGVGVIFLVSSVVPFFISGLIGRFARMQKPATRKRTLKRDKPAARDEEEMVRIPGRIKGLISRESREDHEREANYEPTVRRRR